MAEHDASYKLLVSHCEMVADLIRGFVDGDWTRDLDLRSLERVREIGVSHDLREREDDILWRVRLTTGGQSGWLYLYLLLEFQSTVDRLMAVRLMTYVGLLYQDLQKAGEIVADEALPPVLPVAHRWGLAFCHPLPNRSANSLLGVDRANPGGSD